jgi:hypothetical protein
MICLRSKHMTNRFHFFSVTSSSLLILRLHYRYCLHTIRLYLFVSHLAILDPTATNKEDNDEKEQEDQYDDTGDWGENMPISLDVMVKRKRSDFYCP